MTKKEILEHLQEILNETEDMEEFKKIWNTTDESAYLMAFGMMRGVIRYILGQD